MGIPWGGVDDLRRLRLHNAALTEKLEESLAKNDELELKILKEERRKPLRRHSFELTMGNERGGVSARHMCRQNVDK